MKRSIVVWVPAGRSLFFNPELPEAAKRSTRAGLSLPTGYRTPNVALAAQVRNVWLQLGDVIPSKRQLELKGVPSSLQTKIASHLSSQTVFATTEPSSFSQSFEHSSKLVPSHKGIAHLTSAGAATLSASPTAHETQLILASMQQSIGTEDGPSALALPGAKSDAAAVNATNPKAPVMLTNFFIGSPEK